MTSDNPLARLLARFRDQGVECVLVGGQAVRLNGYLRTTEDIDVLVRATRLNGEKIIRALEFLPSSKDLDPDWFVPAANGEVENIRVADSPTGSYPSFEKRNWLIDKVPTVAQPMV